MKQAKLQQLQIFSQIHGGIQTSKTRNTQRQYS